MAETGVTRTRRPTGTEAGAVPQTAAAGGIDFLQPPQTAAPSFYKIFPNDPITFSWNFTSLIVAPKTLHISAYCDSNRATYAVGNADGTLPGAATQVIWDVYAAANKPGALAFEQAEYTLRIFDERGEGTRPSPGLLAPFSGLKFGLYSPAPYVPLESWSCATCSSGTTSHQIPFALVMTLIVMLVSGWGLLRSIART